MLATRKSSRSMKKNSQQVLDDNLAKLLNSKELSYMKKFGKINFPCNWLYISYILSIKIYQYWSLFFLLLIG